MHFAMYFKKYVFLIYVQFYWLKTGFSFCDFNFAIIVDMCSCFIGIHRSFMPFLVVFISWILLMSNLLRGLSNRHASHVERLSPGDSDYPGWDVLDSMISTDLSISQLAK